MIIAVHIKFGNIEKYFQANKDLFNTEIKAQQYVENIKTHKKGYCLIVKSKYYK